MTEVEVRYSSFLGWNVLCVTHSIPRDNQVCNYPEIKANKANIDRKYFMSNADVEWRPKQSKMAVTAKLISAFVFATRIDLLQFLYFPSKKFPVSSHLLCLYSSVYDRTDRRPRRPVFLRGGVVSAQYIMILSVYIFV